MDSTFESALESLCNLAYVIHLEADDPAKTRQYVDLMEQPLQTLVAIARQARGKSRE